MASMAESIRSGVPGVSGRISLGITGESGFAGAPGAEFTLAGRRLESTERLGRKRTLPGSGSGSGSSSRAASATQRPRKRADISNAGPGGLLSRSMTDLFECFGGRSTSRSGALGVETGGARRRKSRRASSTGPRRSRSKTGSLEEGEIEEGGIREVVAGLSQPPPARLGSTSSSRRHSRSRVHEDPDANIVTLRDPVTFGIPLRQQSELQAPTRAPIIDPSSGLVTAESFNPPTAPKSMRGSIVPPGGSSSMTVPPRGPSQSGRGSQRTGWGWPGGRNETRGRSRDPRGRGPSGR